VKYLRPSLVLTICLFSLTSFGQQQETGLPVFGSFHGGQFDTVNIKSGNLHLEIPILSVPQRVGPDFGYKFVYDMPTWEVNKYNPNPQTTQWNVDPGKHDFAGWHLLTEPVVGGGLGVQYDTIDKTCTFQRTKNDPPTTVHYNVLTNYVAIDGSGTRHPFELRHVQQPQSGCTDPVGDQLTGAALDGSGITMTLSSTGSVLSNSWPLNSGLANGNYAGDTLGRTLLSTTVQKDGNGVETSGTWTVQDSNGAPQQFRVDYSQLNIQTSFCPLVPPLRYSVRRAGDRLEFAAKTYAT